LKPRGSRFAKAKRAQKITLGEMHSSGVRDVLIYCSDHHRSHSIAISADQWQVGRA
jgi:hypothetical protein